MLNTIKTRVNFEDKMKKHKLFQKSKILQNIYARMKSTALRLLFADFFSYAKNFLCKKEHLPDDYFVQIYHKNRLSNATDVTPGQWTNQLGEVKIRVLQPPFP